MQPSALRKRILDRAKDEARIGGLMLNSTRVLAHILTHRDLEHNDVTDVVEFDDRKSLSETAEVAMSRDGPRSRGYGRG